MTEDHPDATRTPRYGVFGNRSFADYFGMYLASRSAFQVGTVGLVWVVFAVTGSALDVAVVGAATTLSTLVTTLPAGVWVDRLDRTKILLASNLVNAVCLVLLAHFGVGPGFSLAAVVAIVIAWGAASEFYRSTSYAVVPELVPEKDLSNANGVAQSGYLVASAVSTVLGGALIVAAGAVSTFVFGAAGYALSALFAGMLVLRTKNAPHDRLHPAPRPGMAKEIKEGFLWLLTRRGLFWISILALTFNFLSGIPTYFMVIYVTKTLGVGAFFYGAILAVFVIGMAAGSLAAGRRPGLLAHSGLIDILCWGFGAGSMILLMGVLPSLYIAFGAALTVGAFIGMGNVLWLTTSHNLVPQEMRGRYFAIDGLLSYVGGPPSVTLGGVLIASMGVAPVFALSGAAILVFSVLFLAIRSLRELDGRASNSSAHGPSGPGEPVPVSPPELGR